MAEDVELADSVSMAMLLVLETLQPIERAVFVLREVFDLEYDEIADAVDKTPGRGTPGRLPGAGTRRRAPTAASPPRPRPEPLSRPSSERSKPASCRACSTSSRRMSSL
jgi:RNA polymerase sigma-70 factor (ECF subfamily)